MRGVMMVDVMALQMDAYWVALMVAELVAELVVSMDRWMVA